MLIRVECRPDERGEEMPNRLFFDRRVVDVRDVLDRWYGEDCSYFKIRSDEGIYIVRHDEAQRQWYLVMFERKADAAGGRL